MTEDELSLLLAALDADDDSIILLDRDRRVVFMNRGAQEMSTIPFEQAAGRTISDVVDIVRERLGRRVEIYRLLDLVISEVMATAAWRNMRLPPGA